MMSEFEKAHIHSQRDISVDVDEESFDQKDTASHTFCKPLRSFIPRRMLFLFKILLPFSHLCLRYGDNLRSTLRRNKTLGQHHRQ